MCVGLGNHYFRIILVFLAFAAHKVSAVKTLLLFSAPFAMEKTPNVMKVHMFESALQTALEHGRLDPAKGLLMLKNFKIRIQRAGCQLNVE